MVISDGPMVKEDMSDQRGFADFSFLKPVLPNVYENKNSTKNATVT